MCTGRTRSLLSDESRCAKSLVQSVLVASQLVLLFLVTVAEFVQTRATQIFLAHAHVRQQTRLVRSPYISKACVASIAAETGTETSFGSATHCLVCEATLVTTNVAVTPSAVTLIVLVLRRQDRRLRGARRFLSIKACDLGRLSRCVWLLETTTVKLHVVVASSPIGMVVNMKWLGEKWTFRWRAPQ